MKKRIGIACIAALLLCWGGAFGADTGKAVTLKIADSFPVKHPMSKAVEHFMAEAKQLSGGGMEFEYFPSEQLGKFKDLMKLCQQGMIDIAYIGVTYFPNELSLNSVPVLPFFTTATEGTRTYLKLLQTSAEIQQEWTRAKLRPLLAAITTQYDVATVKAPISKPEDLKGLRLKSAGGLLDKIAERYGIKPMNVTIAETYEAAERGILDGGVQSIPSIKSYGLQEIFKYGTHGMRMGSYIGIYAVNDRAWKKLDPARQKALLQAGESASLFSCDLWDQTQARLLKEFKEKNGMQFIEITAADRSRWDAPLKGIEEEWINMKENKPKPARKVFEQYKKLAGEEVK